MPVTDCRCLSILFVIVVLCQLTRGHVTLTYPPARKLPLDFLNNFWTKPPCGMPKGTTRTTLVSGSSFNVNWQLGYSHIGGYRLELLDSKERKIMDLTPKETTDGFVNANATAQWYRVTLPVDFTCVDCTIRLVRQVMAFDPKFTFWSCADVDIVEPRRYTENCSNRGRLVGDKCKCLDGFWGKVCQYEDECGTDAQCSNGRGKCIYLGGTNLPRKQCFCAPGFHGEKCSRVNSAKLPESSYNLNLTRHTLQVLTEKMILYHRIIHAVNKQDTEIEFVLLINGTSWGALGWRPVNLGPICKSWPFVRNALDDETESNNVSSRKNRRQNRQPQNSTISSQWAAKDNFAKMDCTDIIIGAARGNYARIRDYYVRGRHTPLLDTVWGGREDITAATGWENDGVTTLIFRRKVRSTDGPDHSFKGEMLVIWAKGQEPDEYIVDQAHRLDKTQARVSSFYVRDEIKYHGIGPQRGFMYMDFLAKQSRVPGINAFILQ